jgi:hypothetical protein
LGNRWQGLLGAIAMRYLLCILGLLCAGLGIFFLVSKPPGIDGAAMELRYSLLVQAGAVLFAAGAATIDIVEAVKSRRE